jgi:small subunit ribosomal protein S8
VDIPSSKLRVRLAEILKEEGFIKNFRLIEDKRQGVLRIYLKYGPGQERVISGLRRVSKPGRRRYVGADRIPSVLGGMGVAIPSPRGGCHGPGVRTPVGGDPVAWSATTGRVWARTGRCRG